MSHSILSPSGAKCWTTCTASVGYVQKLRDEGKIPEEDNSVYADEGTQAHEHAADILEGIEDLEDIEDEDMRGHVGDYVALVNRIGANADEVLVEERVPLFYRLQDGGTIDHAAISVERVQITDLKYGAGVIVDAKENKQLAIYALSLIESKMEQYDFSEDTIVVMTIFQPRTHESNPIKLWSVKLSELREFLSDVPRIVARIEAGKALVFEPSEGACQFCKARGVCVAKEKFSSTHIVQANIDAAKQFTNVEENPIEEDEGPRYPEMESLSDAQVAAIVEHGRTFESWLKMVTKEAKARVAGGVHIEGLKLVEGKMGNRKWADEASADKLLTNKFKADVRYTRSLISVAQAEKLLKKEEKISTKFTNRFKELITRKPGAPILVTDKDERPSIMESPEDMFDDLEEDSSLD